MNDIKRILVITLSNIGDVMLTLPVIGALQQNFKYASIDVVVGPRAKEAFEVDPRINKMYVYDKTTSLMQKVKLILRLKRNKYDLAVDLRNGLLGFFIGSKFRAKPILKSPKDIIHKIDFHLHKIKVLGLNVGSHSYPIWIGESDADNMSKLLKKRGISDFDKVVCVSPGAKSHIKRWTEEGFAKVCDRLIDEFSAPGGSASGGKVKILFVGDANDHQICNRIINSMKNYAVSISGQTNLRELAWCIKRSSLLITNDSAPLHIAGSVGTPSVAIFGPTDYRKYGPREGLGIAFYRKLHCSPCEVALCRYNLECMKAVEADEVFEAAKKILKGELKDGRSR